jgi:hypothetical protein
MPSLAHKRGTRAQIDAAASGSQLRTGEVYLITDEGRLTVGTANNAHSPVAKQSEAGGGGASAIDPISPRQISDDFLSGSSEAGEVGELGWTFTQGSMAPVAAEQNHPGAFRRTSNSTANQIASLILHSTWQANFRFDEWSECTWIFKPTAANTDAIYRFGLTTDISTATPTAAVYLERLNTDTNWFFVTRNASVQTRVDSGIAFGASWVKIRMRRVSATEVRFSINGSAEIAITANIPLAATGLHFGSQIVPTTTTARAVDVDYFSASLLPVVR